MTEMPTSVLFVYTRDTSGNFWVFDGARYHRFLWNASGLWFIRSQAYLPEYAYGECITFNPQQRQLLEEEAARFNIPLAFFDNEAACHSFTVQAHKDQVVFDCTFPGGFFLFK